ncbi:MAG: LptF/LptG family permease [Devosia nanyangense]|uniref:LptF/LptG family permease n=1 Tax=Devosia nanyangense TaxID=1228055 RepID=A0A933NYE1_9HYPH|nr:LptF/LptG family permease [Devosia nanyangense]
MRRIDWIVMKRLGARVALTLTVFFGLMALVESLDIWRFQALTKIGGLPLAVLAIVTGAGKTSVGILPITLLIGTIIGVLDLQSRSELTIIRSAGVSIWRVMRAPLIAAFVLGLASSFAAAPFLIQLNRSLPVSGSNASSGEVWLEQRGADGPYILVAEHARLSGRVLDGVSLFFTEADQRDRVTAASAKLSGGAWVLSEAVRYRPGVPPESLPELRVSTNTTAGDMQVRLTSARDLTFSELLSAVGQRVADPALRAAAITSLLHLAATPALLVGSVLIGFAFTSGYRRTNKYGGAVLYGIVLGFVVYVVTELANRSGFAGVLDPTFAAAGPAFVAIVIGLTVLLYKEDGRA